MKKWIIGLYPIIVLLALCAVVALTTQEEMLDSTQAPSQQAPAPTVPAYLGEVRLYQCDPAQTEHWQAIAAEYTRQTGVRVQIITPKSDDCADALTGYLQQDDAPTIFCLHGQEDAQARKEYCLDLTGTRIAEQLQQPQFALRDGSTILGVANAVSSYGLIYNTQLLARAGYTASDITDFTALRDIVQDITANKKTLGFSAFVSPDLQTASHGGMLCLLAGVSADTDADTLRAMIDLYGANCIATDDFAETDAQDALEDFLSGKAVFYPGGTWEYEKFGAIKDYNLGILPIYIPNSTDSAGLYHICTSYWSVNSRTSVLDQVASLSFLNWLVTARGEDPAPADTLQQAMPYRSTRFAANVLEQLALASVQKGVADVRRDPCDGLSPVLLARLGEALAAYAADATDENWVAVAELENVLLRNAAA